MKDTDILFSIALMILGIVLMYKSMKGNSCRQRLAKLADYIASDKENINFQIKRFGYLLDEMAADNEKNSILKCHADRLEELVTQLDHTRNELEISNLSMADINEELKRSNAELVKRATQLRNEIQQDELAIQKIQERLDSLKRIKVGLEIALNNIQAEEVHYLSEPVFSLGITPSIKSHLESHGI